MKYCPKCGTENLMEAKFCKSCGFSFMTVQVKKEQEANVMVSQAEKPVDNSTKTKNKKERKKLNLSKKQLLLLGGSTTFVVLALLVVILREPISGILRKENPEEARIDSTNMKIAVADDVDMNQPGEKNANAQEPAQVNQSNANKESGQPKQEVKANNKTVSDTENVPHFNTIQGYFGYLSDPQISYQDKAKAQTQLIQDLFNNKNFRVKIQTASGVNTGFVTIYDLTEQVKLNSSTFIIKSEKRNSNKKISELVIIYK